MYYLCIKKSRIWHRCGQYRKAQSAVKVAAALGLSGNNVCIAQKGSPTDGACRLSSVPYEGKVGR